MSLAEMHDALHCCLIEQCAHWVAWVDDDECLGHDVNLDGVLNCSLDGRHRCCPLCILIKVVQYAQAGVCFECHHVQWVLWGLDI